MEELKKCPFCGGEAAWDFLNGYKTMGWSIVCIQCRSRCGYHATKEEAIAAWNTRKPMDHYEDLEERLQSVYGECDGLLEKVVEGLVKHEGVEFEKPMKARLLTDDDVDKWDRLKGAMERIVERLEERYKNHSTSIEGFIACGALDTASKESLMRTECEIAIEIVKGEM